MKKIDKLGYILLVVGLILGFFIGKEYQINAIISHMQETQKKLIGVSSDKETIKKQLLGE